MAERLICVLCGSTRWEPVAGETTKNFAFTVSGNGLPVVCSACWGRLDATPAEGWPATVAALWAESDRLLTRAQAAEAEAERQRARAEAAEGERLGWRAAFYGVRQLTMDECTRANRYRRRALALVRKARRERESQSAFIAYINAEWNVAELRARLAAAESRAAAAEEGAGRLREAVRDGEALYAQYCVVVGVNLETTGRLWRLASEGERDHWERLSRALLAAALPPQPVRPDAPADDGATALSKAEIKDIHAWDCTMTEAKAERMRAELMAGTRTPDNCDCLVCKRKRAGGGNEEADAMRGQGGSA